MVVVRNVILDDVTWDYIVEKAAEMGVSETFLLRQVVQKWVWEQTVCQL